MEPEFYREYELAEERHWWFAGRRRILESLVQATLDRGHRHLVLEAGTGTGAMGQMLSRYGWFVGLDASPHALGRARAKVDRLVGGTLEALPFGDATFDAVFACDVLEHVDDHAAALRELRRICRPTGRLFLTVPAFQFLWSAHDEINHHRRRYTRAQLVDLLPRGGWHVDRLSYFNTLLFLPIAGARLVARTREGTRPRSDLRWRGPGLVNSMLEAVFATERHLVRRWNLPFGVSLLAVATPQHEHHLRGRSERPPSEVEDGEAAGQRREERVADDRPVARH